MIGDQRSRFELRQMTESFVDTGTRGPLHAIRMKMERTRTWRNPVECLSDVPESAFVCHACGRRIVGKECPECCEVSKETAKRCAYCGHNFERKEKIAKIEPFSAKASLLATLFLRMRLIPQEIFLTPEKIVIQTWGFFWLSRSDETSLGRKSPAITTTQDGSGTVLKSRHAARQPIEYDAFRNQTV